jgi:hypothetical protein
MCFYFLFDTTRLQFMNLNYGERYINGTLYHQEKTFLTIKHKDDEDYPIGFNKSKPELYRVNSLCNWIFYIYHGQKYKSDHYLNLPDYLYKPSFRGFLENFDGYVYAVNIPKNANVNVLVSVKGDDNTKLKDCTIMSRVIADKIIITQKYSLAEPSTIDKLEMPLNFDYMLIASAKGWTKILDLLKIPENEHIIFKKCNEIRNIQRLYKIAKHYKCNESIEWLENSGLLNDIKTI